MTEGNATELYASRLGPNGLTPPVFSARRSPDRTHYRIVRCNSCGLLRSDPVATDAVIEDLYSRSSFDYADEVPNLRHTYGRLLTRARRDLGEARCLLEIGCGNGFFLEEALAQGFTGVYGVEPSRQAAGQAPGHIRPHIAVGPMVPGLFEPGQFDVICMFHVLDHLPEPRVVLAECYRLLRPGGLIICVAHDASAFPAKVLGKRSPILDVEHTYLFSRNTAAKLFSALGFEVKRTGPVHNRYSIAYLAHLSPVPGPLKRPLLELVRSTGLARVSLNAPLGNFHLLGQRPGSFSSS